MRLGERSAPPQGHPCAASRLKLWLRFRVLLPRTLLRVEPKGPSGFEDRTTFMVVDRDSFAGDSSLAKTKTGAKTATADIAVSAGEGGAAPSIVVTSTAGAVLYNSSDVNQGGAAANCKGLSQQKCSQNSIVGTCFWDKDDHECESLDKTRPNLLHWPSPLERKACKSRQLRVCRPLPQASAELLLHTDALVDYPRFFVPEWDVMPAPSTVDAALAATNGYDFRNNIDGDTYIFLLGDDLASWTAARGEFVKLAGPCPVLPGECSNDLPQSYRQPAV